MYAIYESYRQLKEDRADLSELSTGASLPAQANNTNRFSGNIPSGAIAPNDQGITAGDLGQDNEEIKVSKNVLKLINSITRCAHRGDYAGIVVDCMHLSKLAQKLTK